jgi:hypothetical protein
MLLEEQLPLWPAALDFYAAASAVVLALFRRQMD